MMLAGLCAVVSLGPAVTPVAAGTNGAENDRAELVALQGPGRPGNTPPTLGWEWWNDADVQKELGLSAEKVERINNYYNRRNTELRPIMHEFQKQAAELEKMTRERVVDVSTYDLQVLRVESARTALYQSRTSMLYRMFRELTPEQHQKLQEILARRFSRRPQGADTTR